MTLTSTSTRPEIKAAYLDNLDYDISGSITKCKACIQALRYLIHITADEVEQSGERIKTTYEKYAAALAKAEKWLAANDPDAQTTTAAGRVKFCSLEHMRQ